MNHTAKVGRYQLGRVIGEGSFAKVRLAVNSETGENVAIKIITKKAVVDGKLMHQVQREISTMKLLDHPNIAKIYEVIASKTKIYIVMEYISGGELSDKLYYCNKLDEGEARKLFQQLIHSIDYCHSKGVYHRDLKPENILLDSKGNVKISDFGLSVICKPGHLLSTTCGSPTYVAPEVINNKAYDGAAADIWSCGVILFELLSGEPPFIDRNLFSLYRKISRAEYKFPQWFTASQKKLLSRLLDPLPTTRITIAEIVEDEWFQTGYEPSITISHEKCIHLDDVNSAFDNLTEDGADQFKSSRFINAFQLIALSSDLDLSGLFEEEDERKVRLGSKHSIHKTISKIESAAKEVKLLVERVNYFKLKLLDSRKLTRCTSHFILSSEVIEVTPTYCVVEVSKSGGKPTVYKEFCKCLSNLLEDSSSFTMES